MSATGEVENAVPEQPTAEVAATEPAQAVEKPAKEKKTRAPREKKPKDVKTASHPPYFKMIEEALLALNEKGGSSPYAIAKYMEKNHKAVLPANFRKILGLQLKNSAARGKLIKVKASYKLSEAGKKDKSKTKVANKAKPAPTSTTVTRGAAKARPTRVSEAVKKTAKQAKKAKKAAPAKPKQPKSIRSPAAKKAKKSVAQV